MICDYLPMVSFTQAKRMGNTLGPNRRPVRLKKSLLFNRSETINIAGVSRTNPLLSVVVKPASFKSLIHCFIPVMG